MIACGFANVGIGNADRVIKIRIRTRERGCWKGWQSMIKNITFGVHESSSFNCNLVSKIDNFMRSMSCSKKWKILVEGRIYNDVLIVKYFVVQQNERALCLICRNNIVRLKQFNIKRHYNSRHWEQYKVILGQLPVDKAHQLKMQLQLGNRKWCRFTKTTTLSLGLNWGSSLLKQYQSKEKPSVTVK